MDNKSEEERKRKQVLRPQRQAFLFEISRYLDTIGTTPERDRNGTRVRLERSEHTEPNLNHARKGIKAHLIIWRRAQ
jgi:hypothetical protein